ncbi:MAG: NifU family protein [Candidatus Caenarcaniphilales bacterium]|nr:NifU family protein [Candidatus Caenarcaniphilales bacterium]
MSEEQNNSTVKEMSEEEEKQFQEDVKKLIDEKIRPALMMDGGDMAIHGFNKLQNGNYEMVVQLVGACGSCPSSAMTMKMGVERMVCENFPQIELITQV